MDMFKAPGDDVAKFSDEAAYERAVAASNKAVKSLETITQLDPEELPLDPNTAKITESVNRALNVYQEVKKDLEEWRKEPDGVTKTPKKGIKDWALGVVTKFEAASTTEKEDTALRLAQARLLARFYSQNHGEALDNTLENIAARIFGQNKDEREFLREEGEKERGLFFEVVSQSLPLRTDDMDTFWPSEKSPKILEGAEVRSARSRNWNRSDVVSELVRRELIKTEEFKKANDTVPDFFIYNPMSDPDKAKLLDAQKHGVPIVQFDSEKREWVCTKKNALLEKLAAKATEINQQQNDRVTTPDNSIIRNGQIVGFIEDKCWEEYEVRALIESINQGQGGELGGNIPPEVLNGKRKELELEPLNYPKEGLNLRLRMAEERRFVGVAEKLTPLLEKQLTAVLRLPANISDQTIRDLQRALEAKGEQVIVERLNLLTAEETEQVATSLMDIHLAERLASRYKEQSGQRSFNALRNLKARSQLLGIANFEELENGTKQKDKNLGIPSRLPETELMLGTDLPGKADQVSTENLGSGQLRELAANLSVEAESPLPDQMSLEKRAALVLQLKKDYEATKKSR